MGNGSRESVLSPRLLIHGQQGTERQTEHGPDSMRIMLVSIGAGIEYNEIFFQS